MRARLSAGSVLLYVSKENVAQRRDAPFIKSSYTIGEVGYYTPRNRLRQPPLPHVAAK